LVVTVILHYPHRHRLDAPIVALPTTEAVTHPVGLLEWPVTEERAYHSSVTTIGPDVRMPS